MENLIIINIDPDREPQIKIGKEPLPEITSPDDAKNMILNDIDWIGKTLVKIIGVADENGYGNKEELVNKCITLLTQSLVKNDEAIVIEKASSIITSCLTNEQLDSAGGFLDLYLEKYKNQDTYDRLTNLLNDKRKELLNGDI